jgi:signal transduction histidine kinase
MRERVALVGGRLAVDRTDGDFRVRVRLPYGEGSE